MKDLTEIETRIAFLKKKLQIMWEIKGNTDQEILDLAEEIDRLLNEYDEYMRNTIKAG